MKRIIMLSVIFVMVISVSFGCDNKPKENINQSEPGTSEELNYEGLVQYYAEQHGVSAKEAKMAINRMRILEKESDETEEIKYRVLTIPLSAECQYEPILELYVETSSGVDDWKISRIKGSSFVGEINDDSWQFAGNVAFWLREDRRVEYTVNGDFGKNSIAKAHPIITIDADGKEGQISYQFEEDKGELKNSAYCDQHDWITFK